MKKLFITLSLVMAFFACTAVSASAAVNHTVKVGLRYGADALETANLENAVGCGYYFGYYDNDLTFVALDRTNEMTISVTNLSDTDDSQYLQVTKTGTDEVLFEFQGSENFAILPDGDGEEAETWFKGYKYPGGFEYIAYQGKLQVINVVDMESYVKGVIPFEMNENWPAAALEAQAVCARTYALKTRHASNGFDICNTTHCQVYYGRGSGKRGPSELSDRAVDYTAGEVLYFEGTLVDTAVYHSHDGGATENAENVWGREIPYLLGKEDPYEKLISIPNYSYSVLYTGEELTYILSQKGYDIGDVKDVYVSEFTENGNVKKVTFEGTKGIKTFTGESCRTIFYTSTYNKSVRSMRFTINGAKNVEDSVYINDAATKLKTLEGVAAISGSGELTILGADSYTVLTASGKSNLQSTEAPKSNADGKFLIEGTGSGHNVGMSQYGAKAMAEIGCTYDEILNFYYTDITIE